MNVLLDRVVGCLTFGAVDLWKTMIHYQTPLKGALARFWSNVFFDFSIYNTPLRYF